MSVVSPFRYTRMLFSVAVGIIILGEEVNSMMMFGCALTIGAGLYIWRRYPYMELVLKPEPVTTDLNSMSSPSMTSFACRA